MAKQEKEPDSPTGAFPTPRARKERTAEKVAERVRRLNRLAPAVPGVMPLNAGFFALQRIRQVSVESKKRGQKRAKVRSR